MLSKINNTLSKFLKNPVDNIGLDMIQKALNERLQGTIDEVFEDRQNDLLNSQLSPEELDKLFKEYLIKNVALASASSFIPGPAGIAAAIPTMIGTLSNQMKIAYDVSCSFDKEENMVKGLLLDIPLQAMGVSTGLAEIQDLDSFDDDIHSIQDKIIDFGKIYGKKKLKGALTKSIPGLGSIFAVVEAKLETKNTFKTATSFFDPSQIIINPAEPDPSKEALADEEKVKALINLMTIDNVISPDEKSYLLEVITNSDLSKIKKKEYSTLVNDPKNEYDIDYSLIKAAGHQESTILDMVVMSKRDNEVLPVEIEYVAHIASKLNMDPSTYKTLTE